jgi:hypothetical protein
MHPVDQEVKVRVGAVAVGHDDSLVLGKSEPVEYPIGNALHGRPVNRILGIEAQGNMVDWLLDSIAARRRGTHERSRELRVLSR